MIPSQIGPGSTSLLFWVRSRPAEASRSNPMMKTTATTAAVICIPQRMVASGCSGSRSGPT